MLPGTVNSTLPLPVTLLPEVIVMKLSLLTAVQTQSVPTALMLTVFFPPLAVKVTVVAFSVNVHSPAAAAPAWFTVNVCPAIVIVPVTGLVLLLAATS